VPPGRHRIDEDELDLLVRADHEDVADGLVVGRGARLRVALDLCGQHPVELRDVEVGVADDRVVGRLSLRLLDGLRPALVVAGRSRAQAGTPVTPASWGSVVEGWTPSR